MTRGFFGIGVWHPKTGANIGTLYRSAEAFGAAFIFTVGRRYRQQVSDTTKAHRNVPLVHYADLDDLRRHLPHGCPLVGVEITGGAIPLDAFSHPERCAYICGAEDHGLTREVLDQCHGVVAIPGATACLNVAVAGSIVAYDRMTKTQQQRRRAAA